MMMTLRSIDFNTSELQNIKCQMPKSGFTSLNLFFKLAEYIIRCSTFSSFFFDLNGRLFGRWAPPAVKTLAQI